VGILVGIVLAAGSTTYVDGTTTTDAAAKVFANVLWVTATLLYFGLLDGRGQTVGKLALGIAVRSDQTGYAIGPGRGIGRRAVYLLLWAALFVPGIINVLSPLWDRKRQAWHDHAVGSVVIKVR
jgi:uncharacterized RDD family membrane protein YckC